MGVTISTDASTAPLFIVSTTTGFISFAFTLSTLLRVFWTEIQTFKAAPREIPDFLTNLKQSLYEEKWHLRRARKLSRRRRAASRGGEKGRLLVDRDGDEVPEWDIALRAMQLAISHMIEKFHRLEAPFVRNPVDVEHGNRPVRRSSGRRLDHGLYRLSRNHDDDDLNRDEQAYVLDEYKHCGMRERWRWTESRSKVLSLSESASRMTTRRMSIQITFMSRLVSPEIRPVHVRPE